MFAPDLGDFEEKLFYYLQQEEERQAIVSQAYRHVRERHTWDKRVEQFTQVIEQHFFDRNSNSVAHGTSS
jgi:spore maturation protein CgeB